MSLLRPLGTEVCEGNPTFWEELFLLRVNASFLERCVILTSEEQLLQMRKTQQAIFANACRCLHDPVKIRVAHALETLCILLRSIFRKKFSSFGVSALDVLCTAETAREQFVELLSTLNALLLDKSYPELFRRLALTELVIIATATEQSNKNPFLPYFMDVDLFSAIIQLLHSGHESPLAADALFLLAILLNYRGRGRLDEWNKDNIYRARLAASASAPDVQVLLSAASDSLQALNRTYADLLHDPKQNAGVLSRMTGFLSGWFSAPTEDPYAKISNYQTGAVLLSLYQAVKLPPHKLNQHHQEEAHEQEEDAPTPPPMPEGGRSEAGEGTEDYPDDGDSSDADADADAASETPWGDEEEEVNGAEGATTTSSVNNNTVDITPDVTEGEAAAKEETAPVEQPEGSTELVAEPPAVLEESGGEDDTDKGKEERRDGKGGAVGQSEDENRTVAEDSESVEAKPVETEEEKKNEKEEEEEKEVGFGPRSQIEQQPQEPIAGALLARPSGGEVGETVVESAATTTAPEKPPDVLVNFLSFAAYLLPDMRDERQKEYGRLCLRTLLRLTEERSVNRTLHDPALATALPIYRKTKTTKSVTTKTQPLASSLIDIMICVMRGNLKRQLPSDIFCPCLNIIRRLVIYQKTEGVRLQGYNWHELWSCLLSLIRLVCSGERGALSGDRDDDAAEADVARENLLVAEQLVLLLNIFITFGPRIFPSTELPMPTTATAAATHSPPTSARSLSSSLSSSTTPPLASSFTSHSTSSLPTLTTAGGAAASGALAATAPMSRSLGYGSFGAAALPLYRTQPLVDIPAYFQLIYEIIHNSALIRTFVEWAALQSAVLMHRLDNVSNIIIHFTAKVDEWYAEHPEQTLFAEQVMEIIRQHYPTLSLASTSELTSDRVVKHKDTEEEAERVLRLLKALVSDYRATIVITPVPEDILTLPSPRDHLGVVRHSQA